MKPHYHNFFWGKNTEERVSFIATTAELQAKAGAKNSLKVSFAVNPILRSHTGWKRWRIVFFFILVLLIIIQQLCGLFVFIAAFNHLAKNVLPGAGLALNNNHPECINSCLSLGSWLPVALH